jgi:hypothetical protein
VHAAIEAFLAAARQPVLQEPGELPFPLTAGHYGLEVKAGALQVCAWDDTRQLHRRAIAVSAQRPGRLTLTIERFGGKLGQITLYDQDAPAALTLNKQAERHHFREVLRALVNKAFPAYRLLEISADIDLEHSLSANYPRALLRKGQEGIAVIGAAAGPADPAQALTYGLIWLSYLRSREPKLRVETLALFLPQPALMPTALRLRWLAQAAFRLFTYSPEGQVCEVDPADCGNLHTELLPAQPYTPSPLHLEADITPKGLRLRGLELPDAAALTEMARLRQANPPDRLNPLYTRRPEAWLESQIRRHLETIDATLQPVPLYGQVIAVTGVDRGIADLLAAGYDGRLAVLEIKAAEDIHLPLQALDYWMRIAHHAAQDDFGSRNYFPGQRLRPDPPRLLLAAPALGFHPTTETILRFFSSNIAVERIGLGLEWRHTVRVLFRCRGADSPG